MSDCLHGPSTVTLTYSLYFYLVLNPKVCLDDDHEIKIHACVEGRTPAVKPAAKDFIG
jgi:hypothetical protein